MCNAMASVIFCFIDNQIVYQKSNIYFWLKNTFDSQRVSQQLQTCLKAAVSVLH